MQKGHFYSDVVVAGNLLLFSVIGVVGVGASVEAILRGLVTFGNVSAVPSLPAIVHVT